MLLQFHELFTLALLQSRDRNVRPTGNNFGDVFVSHFFAEQSLLALGTFCSRVGQFLFELGNSSVVNLACSGEFTTPLGAFELRTKSIKLFLPFSLLFNNGLFLLPFGLERSRLFLELGQFSFKLLQSFLACWILLFLERLPFHFMLHDPALDHVALG